MTENTNKGKCTGEIPNVANSLADGFGFVFPSFNISISVPPPPQISGGEWNSIWGHHLKSNIFIQRQCPSSSG